MTTGEQIQKLKIPRENFFLINLKKLQELIFLALPSDPACKQSTPRCKNEGQISSL
jgi:hypothetical protein